MQDLYAAAFRVQVDDLDHAYSMIGRDAASWAWRGPGAPPDVFAEASGERPEISGYRMSWAEWAVDGRTERALEVVLRHPDPQVAGREWRTLVDVCRASDSVTVTTRVTREAVELRMTPAALTTLRRPGLIPKLLNAHPCLAGGLDLTATPALLHVTGVGDFIEDVLRNPDRALPVIVLGPPTGRPSEVEPSKVADELAGLAHVAVVGGHLAWRRFGETIGEALRVPRGGARIYWPGLGHRGDDLHHRYWTFRAIEEQRVPFHRVLFGLLARVSVHAVPLDRLPMELRRAAGEARLRELTAAGSSQEELLELYDEENRELRRRVDELTATVAEQARLLDRHKENYAAIAMATAEEPEEEAEAAEVEAAALPETWDELIEYLPLLESEAFVVTEAAREPSPYPDPGRMWAHLEALAEAAQDWAAHDCSVGMRLEEWIQANYGIQIALHDNSLGDGTRSPSTVANTHANHTSRWTTSLIQRVAAESTSHTTQRADGSSSITSACTSSLREARREWRGVTAVVRTCVRLVRPIRIVHPLRDDSLTL